MRRGRFVIPNIPGRNAYPACDTHRVRTRSRGSSPVPAGGTAEVDLELSISAIALDGVVVTATGEQRRRELGNAVENIAAAAVREVAPVHNLSDLLQGRSAGVQGPEAPPEPPGSARASASADPAPSRSPTSR